MIDHAKGTYCCSTMWAVYNFSRSRDLRTGSGGSDERTHTKSNPRAPACHEHRVEPVSALPTTVARLWGLTFIASRYCKISVLFDLMRSSSSLCVDEGLSVAFTISWRRETRHELKACIGEVTHIDTRGFPRKHKLVSLIPMSGGILLPPERTSLAERAIICVLWLLELMFLFTWHTSSTNRRTRLIHLRRPSMAPSVNIGVTSLSRISIPCWRGINTTLIHEVP